MRRRQRSPSPVCARTSPGITSAISLKALMRDVRVSVSAWWLLCLAVRWLRHLARNWAIAPHRNRRVGATQKPNRKPTRGTAKKARNFDKCQRPGEEFGAWQRNFSRMKRVAAGSPCGATRSPWLIDAVWWLKCRSLDNVRRSSCSWKRHTPAGVGGTPRRRTSEERGVGSLLSRESQKQKLFESRHGNVSTSSIVHQPGLHSCGPSLCQTNLGAFKNEGRVSGCLLCSSSRRTRACAPTTRKSRSQYQCAWSASRATTVRLRTQRFIQQVRTGVELVECAAACFPSPCPRREEIGQKNGPASAHATGRHF